MFDGVDFSKMGAMLEEAQKKAKELQDEQKSKIFTAKSGGGLVSVSVSGSNEIIDVTIDDSLLSDKDAMQILLISALNDALRMVATDQAQMASKMLGGFGGFGGQ
jgi:DNA-binding YbaB/EbfC family protein